MSPAYCYSIGSREAYLHAHDSSKGTPFRLNRPFKEVFIDVDGAQLNALIFEHPKADGIVLYFHGNAGALDTWGDIAEDFLEFPYHVIVFDYRGLVKAQVGLRVKVRCMKMRLAFMTLPSATSIWNALFLLVGL